jgi:hypothetical protein
MYTSENVYSRPEYVPNDILSPFTYTSLIEMQIYRVKYGVIYWEDLPNS